MADQIVSDLIMKFVGDDNQHIPGETSTELNLPSSGISAGFVTGQMFELESFTFKTGLGGEDMDEAAKKQTEQTNKATEQVHKDLQKIAKERGIDIKDLKMPREAGFKDFRTNKNSKAVYPVDMKPIEITRSVDLTSPYLLDYCIKRRVFKSASLIKRKAAGGVASGEVFLRIDFKTVLIKSIDWDNDEPVKETFEFVCRAVAIQYLPQLPDGTLGAAIKVAWTAAPGVTAETGINP